MANWNLFSSFLGKAAPAANTKNAAGGIAYKRSSKQALAQLVSTGCFNSTFYASAQDQLDTLILLCDDVEPEFMARAALYSRRQASMKDMPAVLCALLSVKSPGLLAEVFDRVINTPKMLRNFVQIMRSGVTGRKSLGTLPKRLIQQWLEKRSESQLFIGSVGQSPSLQDIVKMVHPKPATPERTALYAYLLGRSHEASLLPEVVQQFERFKSSPEPQTFAVPDVPFEMLTALPLTNKHWMQIAKNASWQMTRMNLNTFLRHGVFEDEKVTKLIADRLRSSELIAKAKPFPYQLLMAYTNASEKLPQVVRNALQDAMEIAVASVPKITGKVFVFPDVSGSMHSPVTGYRKGSTSDVRCIDVAALVAAAIVRQNPEAEVIPFETKVVAVTLNPRDSILTNANRLASLPCGGTNCSAPLQHLNDRKAKGDLIVYVSDNESWIDTPNHGRFGGTPTETMKQWQIFKTRNRSARMVCIDIQPSVTSQTVERADIVNVGGFSDQVFSLLSQVAAGGSSEDHWVKTIEAISI